MLTILAALATTAHVATPPNHFSTNLRHCQAASKAAQRAAPKAPAARFQRLGDLPDAHRYLAVFRLDGDGCPAPQPAAERHPRR